MQSEFHRLVTQVGRLERMHRSGVVLHGDVDELFALGRECAKTIEDEAARRPVDRVAGVTVGTPAPTADARDDIAAVAHEIGGALESAIARGLGRLFAVHG